MDSYIESENCQTLDASQIITNLQLSFEDPQSAEPIKKPQLLIENIKRKHKGKHKSSIKVGPSNFDSTEGSKNSKDDLINLNVMDSTHLKIDTGQNNSFNVSNEESKEYKTSGPTKFNQVKIKESNLLFSDGSTFMDRLGGLKP